MSNFNENIFCEFFGKDETFLLGVCYRSPNSPEENDRNMRNLLAEISHHKADNTVILGDFNYNMINWNLRNCVSPSPSAELFLAELDDLFLEQLVTEPTRYRLGQRSNILDLVLTNNTYFIEEIKYCEPVGCSDHLSLLV